MSQPPVTYVDPREQVQMPAIVLMAVSALGMLGQVGALLARLLGMGLGSLGAREGSEAVVAMMSGAVGIVISLLGLAIGAFIIYGAFQMKELRSYGMAMAAAVAAMVPCISPCCCLGLPVGIWALVVLLKPEVKQAFS